jgi:hypothetical protein
MTYQLVKDDTAPQVKATLTRDDTGAAIDCSGGTVRMYFRAKGGSSMQGQTLLTALQYLVFLVAT